MKALRWIGSVFAILVSLGVLVALLARGFDGPVGPLAGGPFETGEEVSGPVDWAFVEDVRELELQLVEPPRSRTVWIVHHRGAAYIPCGFPDFRLWKQWPHHAVADGRAVLRSDGRLYPGRLVKVEDPELFRAVGGVVLTKYEMDAELDSELLWLFRFES